ncbi:hypothetical protein AOQ84DRAFT_212418 [Glonium stellatum]|uniref:Uncharacterized protein n=1 Tax=Glonium stellatum TaxID=574774 RepID=A0A8E2F544_9PEZI|nr:hypothetical protein AOQ84DRAFT_212418 [Glonium stellatum]
MTKTRELKATTFISSIVILSPSYHVICAIIRYGRSSQLRSCRRGLCLKRNKKQSARPLHHTQVCSRIAVSNTLRTRPIFVLLI